MPEKAPRTMKSAMDELRERSPELDRRIAETEARRKLALSLVAMRRRAGLTQKEVAAAMDCDQAFVSRMESSTGPTPMPQSVQAYAHACHAAAGYVFAMEGDGDQVMVVPLGTPDEAEALENAVQGAASG